MAFKKYLLNQWIPRQRSDTDSHQVSQVDFPAPQGTKETFQVGPMYSQELDLGSYISKCKLKFYSGWFINHLKNSLSIKKQFLKPLETEKNEFLKDQPTQVQKFPVKPN